MIGDIYTKVGSNYQTLNSSNNYIKIKSSFAYLLNLYPNATLGFDLRKLRIDYTGFCIRVRRSSDNATLDIGFVNNVIDTDTLLSFVGAGSGYVTIWYNQATSNNATQTVAVYQPRIVNSGALQTKNGKPSIYFGGNQYLDCGTSTNLNLVNNLYQFVVGSSDSLSGVGVLISRGYTTIGTGRYSIYRDSTNIVGFVSTSAGENGAINSLIDTSQKIFSHSYKQGVTASMKVNTVENSLVVSGTTSPPSNIVSFKIGAYTNADLVTPSLFWVGHIQEVANYYNDQSANRSGIESNIKSYYGTY